MEHSEDSIPKRNDTESPSVKELLNRISTDVEASKFSEEDTSSWDVTATIRHRPRIVIGITGSVAAIKIPILASKLSTFCDICVVMTRSSLNFVRDLEFPASALPVLTDEKEWYSWKKVGDPVVHILLRQWADAMVIAPSSANTLAKIANGLCDNLLTSIVRAWDFKKPLLLAPAMNTFMWESPFTSTHLQVCRDLGVDVVAPIQKRLACGDVGTGAMADPEDIIAKLVAKLQTMGFNIDSAFESIDKT